MPTYTQGQVMSSYTMLVELLPHRWRSTGGGLFNVLWSAGATAMAIVAYLMQGMSWRYLNAAFSAGFVFCLILPCFLDESVRWLMATGNVAEVEKILRKACRLNGKGFQQVKKILHDAITESPQKQNPPASGTSRETSEGAGAPNELLLANEANASGVDTSGHAQKTDLWLSSARVPCVEYKNGDSKVGGEMEVRPAKYTVLDICRHRVILVPVVAITCVWVTNSLFYYGAMLGSASLAGNRFLNFGLLTSLDTVFNAIAACIMQRFNRKTLGTFFGFVASLSLFFSVATMQLVGGSTGKTLATLGWFVGMCSVSGSYCALFVVNLEIFPTCMRSTARATGASISRLAGMLAPFVVLLGEETPWAPGLLIGTLCFLATFTIRLLPETRHRKLPTTIEEVKAWNAKYCPVATESAEKSLIQRI